MAYVRIWHEFDTEDEAQTKAKAYRDNASPVDQLHLTVARVSEGNRTFWVVSGDLYT